jgi:hypothetical protein
MTVKAKDGGWIGGVVAGVALATSLPAGASAASVPGVTTMFTGQAQRAMSPVADGGTTETDIDLINIPDSNNIGRSATYPLPCSVK